MLAFAAAASAANGVLELPYRQAEIRIDGDLEDWTEPVLKLRFREDEVDSLGANQVRARVVWDVEWLYVAFEVRDNEVFPPPPGIEDFRIARWDSVELYLDVDASGGHRLAPDDFQIILSCNGRAAAMRGDPLLGAFAQVTVPKLPEPRLAILSASRSTAWGYQIEAKVPFAGLGLAQPHRDARLNIDVGCNDWLADHPVLPEPEWGIEMFDAVREDRLWTLIERDSELTEADVKEILQRDYRPVAWSGSRDWGFPDEWRAVRLTGSASLLERTVQRLGLASVVDVLAMVAIVLLIGLLIVYHRSVRRVRAVLAMLDALRASRQTESPSDLPLTDVARSRESMRDLTALEAGAVTSNGPAPGGDICPAPPSLATRAIDVIMAAPTEVSNPTELARRLNTSLRTLQRHLAAENDCTPSDLILAVRMRAAYSLLLTGELQVTEVAARLGFGTPSYFSSRFKAYFGCTPREAMSRGVGNGRSKQTIDGLVAE